MSDRCAVSAHPPSPKETADERKQRIDRTVARYLTGDWRLESLLSPGQTRLLTFEEKRRYGQEPYSPIEAVMGPAGGISFRQPGDTGLDADHDALLDDRETELGTDPLWWDTDDDGLSDAFEVEMLGSDPLDADDH